jgi:hypothetical protein
MYFRERERAYETLRAYKQKMERGESQMQYHNAGTSKRSAEAKAGDNANDKAGNKAKYKANEKSNVKANKEAGNKPKDNTDVQSNNVQDQDIITIDVDDETQLPSGHNNASKTSTSDAAADPGVKIEDSLRTEQDSEKEPAAKRQKI